MQIKIKYLQAYASDFIFKLRDIRFAGQVVFAVIVLMISWSGVKAIQLNYNLQKTNLYRQTREYSPAASEQQP